MSPVSFKYSSVAGENVDDGEYALHTRMPKGTSSHYARLLRSFKITPWPATFFLLIAILVCELSILHKQPASPPIGAEINGLVPQFSTQQVVFRADNRYASDHQTKDSINVTMQNWLELIPRGGGFVDIPQSTSYQLPPAMHYNRFPNKEIYSIAVFHELHCLMHLSSYIDKLALKIQNRDFTLDLMEIGHNDHCFNYLRNAIMCCGDTTLEGQSPNMKVAGTEGTDAAHVCRNFDEISTWAEGQRVTDEKGNS